MKPTSITTATRDARPNRILIILATAWMILSLAIGGAVTADVRADSATVPSQLTTATQP